MLPEGVTVQDYKERKIANFYLGRSKPVSILTSPGITGDEFNKQEEYVVKALIHIVGDAKQTAKDNDTDKFEWCLELLQQLGPKRRLGGVDDLVRGLKEYMQEKPKSLLDFYQHALW